jgi:hypothetical protein
VDGEPAQVMLDLNGETAPEIEFSLPAYANEAQRIANEQQRIANEQQRIANEEQRINKEQQRITNENQRVSNEEARVTEFARLKRESEQATEDANDAAVLATTAADLANAKAQLAVDAANLANQKAQLADDKAALAAAAADLATAKAQFLALGGQELWCAMPQSDASVSVFSDDFRPGRTSAIVIGNEANGITRPELGCPVTIPMPGHAESLNAAQATTVLLFEALRKSLS